jgi:putative ABC transport system permease protein
MDALLSDLRYAVRTLVKRPGFAAVTILTLALGIGANTAIFSVVNAVLLRPLPFPSPERLVMVWETAPGNETRSVAPGNLTDWRGQSRIFEQVAGYSDSNFNLTGGAEPERLAGATVSENFFAALGVAAARGRTFSTEDAARPGERVAILSDGLWRRRFGSDANLLGRNITLDGKSYTVVGVMPPGFHLPATAELWALGERGVPVPPSLAAQFPDSDFASHRDAHFVSVVARLKPGATLEQAQAEMSAIAQRLEQEYPETNSGLGVNVIPLHQQVVGRTQTMLWLLVGAVSLVLLIACANVANLLLARTAQREREIAIRMALGAGRLRLIRQTLTESLLLSVVGGAVGLLVALWGVDLFVSLSPGDIPRLGEVGVDARLLGFALVISLVTGIGFGLLPALQSSRLDLNASLKEGGTKATEGRRRRRTRSLLVVSEIALAQVLLVGAGLLLTSFLRLQSVDPGFNPEQLLTARVALSLTEYSDRSRRAAFYEEALRRLHTVPGVHSAAMVMNLPLSGSTMNRGFRIEGQAAPRADEDVTMDYQVVSPGYFSTMHIPVVRGRALTEADDERAQRVVVINERLARRYWPGADPTGRRLAIGDPSKEESWRTIVGVVGDVHHAGLSQPPFPGAYVPYRQDSESWSRMSFVVRAAGDPANLAAAVRREFLAIDANQPISHVQPMKELMSASVMRTRFVSTLVSLLALISLALAAVGIYGLMSFSVSERTQEIGIRMALGARTRDILKMVFKQGMTLTLSGVGLGLAAAFALTRVMSSLLYGVSATDPVTFVGISLLLAAVALLACYVPARRATRVDPMVALRYE